MGTINQLTLYMYKLERENEYRTMQNAYAPEPLLFPLVNISFSMSGSDIKSEKKVLQNQKYQRKELIYLYMYIYISYNHYENV